MFVYIDIIMYTYIFEYTFIRFSCIYTHTHMYTFIPAMQARDTT